MPTTEAAISRAEELLDEADTRYHKHGDRERSCCLAELAQAAGAIALARSTEDLARIERRRLARERRAE